MLFRFIHYCEQEQCYTGFDYKDAEGEDDLVTRLASLKINTATDGINFNDLNYSSHFPYLTGNSKNQKS